MTKILIVDDELGPRLALQVVLQIQLNAEVTTCDSPAKALQMFAASNPGFDLVIVDLRMPEMLGSDLVAQIRKTHPGIRAILHTGYDDIKQEGSIEPNIFHDTLLKPAKAERIIESVRNALNGNRDITPTI